MTQSILVIEDEPAIADNVTYALTTEGFRVQHCATGGAGLAALAQAPPFDLLVLDVGLPDANGFELCKQIRQTSAIPIIFLTARADEIDRIVGLEIGGDDYIVKPFSPRELAARVKVVLRRSTPPPLATPPEPPENDSTTPMHSDFAIDANRMRILYRGHALELARCEFLILETLIRRPGWVFTRQQLMERALDDASPSGDRTIDTHIKTLRAKLKEIDPGPSPIQTHRGFGYALKEPS